MSFWGELKRRNVFKVGAAYVIVAWLIVQVANTFCPILHLPEWIVTLVAFLLILGLPVALILAWAYEMTPEGVKLTKKVPLADSITHVTGRKLNYILAGLIIVLVGYIVIDKAFVSREPVDTKMTAPLDEQVATAPEVKEAPKTIAVLPFENLSSDPEQEHFVDGLSEELLNCLAKIGGLRVTSRTSSFAFKNTDKILKDVADVLGVEHILEGSVRKAGDVLRITAQLIRVKDDSHLWSNQYDRELKNVEDILSIQGDIAENVAKELKVALGVGESLKQLGGTDNVEAYELYLTAKAISNELTDNFSVPKLKIDRALELDPEFALAWALKSSIYLQSSRFVSEQLSTKELEESQKAAQRSIELEPNLVEANCALGTLRAIRGEWIEAEWAYRKAFDSETQSTSIKGDYIAFLSTVGYLDRGNKMLEEALKNDPLNQLIRVFYVFSVVRSGDKQRAENENDRLIELFGADVSQEYFIRLNFKSNFKELLSDGVVSFFFPEEQIERITSPEDFLAELRHLYADQNFRGTQWFVYSDIAAYCGDPELALNIIEMDVRNSFMNINNCWEPVMHEVRQLPRFKEFVREIGLVDYWNQFGYPDLCHPTDDGDFECD